MKKAITLSLTATLFLTGCASSQLNQVFNDNAGKIGGTAAGAGIGAAIGKQVAGNEGMLVGVVVGGAIGYFIGSNIDERRMAIQQIAEQEKINVFFEDVKDEDGDVIGQAFITEDKYQFNTASSALNPKAKEYFSKIAAQYAKSGQKVLIIGHTDDRGSDNSNYLLSENRAKAVAQIFKDVGVDGKNIYFYGLGETKPIATNKTLVGQGKNRRVEIVEAPSEEEIARYAYMKPANSSLYNEEKVGAHKKAASDKSASLLNKQAPTLKSKEEAIAMLPQGTLEKIAQAQSSKQAVAPISNGAFDKKTQDSNDSSAPTTQKVPEKQSPFDTAVAPTPSVKNLDGKEILLVGNGASDNKGVCRDNDFLFYAKNKEDTVNFTGGKKYNPNEDMKEFEKIVGLPVYDQSFSIVTKAYAGTSNEFYGSCLQDPFKEKGTVKNFETGVEVLQEKVVTAVPWLDGTQWYSSQDDMVLSLSPISVQTDGVEPLTCPELNFIKKGNASPTLGMSTKVVTRQGDKGFIYRVFPTVKNTQNNFECMDIAFSDNQSDTAKANIYYSQKGNYYKKEVELALLRATKEEKGWSLPWK